MKRRRQPPGRGPASRERLAKSENNLARACGLTFDNVRRAGGDVLYSMLKSCFVPAPVNGLARRFCSLLLAPRSLLPGVVAPANGLAHPLLTVSARSGPSSDYFITAVLVG